MRSRATVLAVLLALALGTPLAASARSPGAADADPAEAETELAERYAPLMVLVEQAEACGPGEPYLPSDVEPMMDESSIALRGPWTDRDLVTVGPSAEELSEGLEGYALDMPGDPLKPGCTYEKWVASVWGRSPTPTVYAHVATRTSSGDGRPGRGRSSRPR